jgi:hypothetical protein
MAIKGGYKLEFNWKGIRYEGHTARFEAASFTGPVLASAARVLPNDFISLDFTDQNKSGIFLPNYYYIARLKWGGLVYQQEKIVLADCLLDHHKAGSLKELKDGMKIYIDCSKHEAHVHHKFLVYPAWVVNEHGEELK